MLNLKLGFTWVEIYHRYCWLILPLGGFFGWVLSFILFGPVLFELAAVRGADPAWAITSFLMTHTLTLLTGAFFFAAEKIKGQVKLACLLTGVPTVLFLLLPSFWWPLLGVFQGVGATILVLTWTDYFGRKVPPQKRARVMALTILLASFALYVITLAHRLLPLTLLTAATVLPLLLPWCYGQRAQAYQEYGENEGRPDSFRFLIPVVVILFSLGGLMYGSIMPFYYTSPWHDYLNELNYMVFVLVAGWLMDTHGRRIGLFFAFSFMGLGFLLVPVFSGLGGQLIAAGLVMGAFSFADVFMWVILADIAPTRKLSTYYGLGLGLNTGTVLLGFLVAGLLPDIPAKNLMNVSLLAVLALFLGLPFINYLPDGISNWAGKGVSNGSTQVPAGELAERPFNGKGNLTPRERQIVELVLANNSYEAIAAELFITPNTLKTHMRNIFRKMGVKNRSQLVIQIMQEDNNR